MTTQDTIFKSDQDTSQNQTTQNQNGPSEYLGTLVGEARKYKTPDELAKAYLHLDEFTERLKQENAQLRDQVAQSKTISDVLERLNTNEQQTTQDQGGKKADTTSSLSASDVAAIVKDTLTGMETARTKQDNLRKADAAMRQVFGDKAAEVFQQEASTPEMKRALMELASVSPDKFVALFQKGAGAPSGQVDGTATKVNTVALNGGAATGREADPECKEFYSKLRRDNPKAYYSQAMQLQMTQAAERNSAKFFGRS